MSKLITVNKERCTVCGQCVTACPAAVLKMTENGPVSLFDSCIGCGHCVAVCPSDALDNKQAPLAQQTPRKAELAINAEQATEFLRSRRSIRKFKDKPVDKELLEQMLNMGRFAPTGGNSQGVAYLVIQDTNTLHRVTELCVAYLDEWFKTATTPMARKLQVMVNRYHKTGYDVILCGAPCLVVTLGHPLNPIRRDSSVLSLIYTQLFAPTQGIATCWAGLVEYALNGKYQPLMDLLRVPDGLAPTGAMMVGYPAYTHKRMPDRDPLQVYWHQGE